VIVISKVRYKNFLAAGNAWIEIVLNEHPSTLIVGVNGVGKSTMSEAVCFALFGRPLRDVNKALLVNTINQRECLVELEFRIGTVTYVVKRGMKPTIFEIYENGTLLDPPAAANDYQVLLETSILHLNYKSFRQVVILGNASYIPFMRLNASSRRAIIEDLLDIEVFSSMNALTKDETTNLRIELEKCVQAKTLIGEQRKMAQSFTEHLEEKRSERIATLEALIAEERALIAARETSIASMKSDLAGYDTDKQQLAGVTAKRREYERKLTTIKNVIAKMTKERVFYEEHDNCPQCEQTITEAFKASRIVACEKKAEDAAKATAQCDSLIKKYQRQEEAAEQRLQEATDIERQMHGLEAQLPLMRSRVRDLLNSIEREKQTKPAAAASVDVDELDRQLDILDTSHAALSNRRVIVDAASMLLKDNGIKARIIKHYLPIINKTINHYLTAMDFPILFTLDEEFNEIIKSRHRDTFEYNLFSEGEKKRIDLALLLTWRAVAKLKNSAATNLLVLDEVFDGSLDANGTEEFLKIIAAMEADTNVWVISHKGDQYIDKFAHTLTFEKHRGFSQLKS
jgi:DNA repair exonuclease SbcCD ATPase subunit